MIKPPLEFADLAPWTECAFARSDGPGGQNVNKRSTRATLLFDFETCPLLSHERRARLRARFERRLSRDGRLQLVAQTARTQLGNRIAAEERLLELLASIWNEPRPRRPTRPTRAAKERRLRAKRRTGARKRERSDGAREE